MMNDEKPPITEEAKDPKLPVIHGTVPGSRGENHRRNQSAQ